MEKPLLKYHPSLLIIQKNKSRDILMSVYDNTYPVVIYRNAANLIGGNPTFNDKCPLDVLLREVNEELNIIAGKEDLFASSEDINKIKEEIIAGITPFSDFFFHVDEIKGGRKEHQAIGSVFYSIVDKEIFNIARKNIIKNYRLTTEGKIEIFNIENLIKGGKFSTAHLTAPILGEYFNVKIPYPAEIYFKRLSSPKKSFEEYFSEFIYEEGWRRH